MDKKVSTKRKLHSPLPGNPLKAGKAGKFLYSERSGISILIALGLVIVIVFFGLLVGNVVVSSIRQSANVNRANVAYFGAEGALEQGLLFNYQHGVGFTQEKTPVTYPGGLEATYEIQGQVPEDLIYGPGSGYDGMYGVPTPGTGNVGSNCDKLNPVIEGTFVSDGSTYQAADHPCNWNKIKVGETVAVPLYYTDENGDAVNLFTSQSQELILRVRTPCSDGSEMCSETGRIIMLFNSCGSIEPFPCNDPIISWQISGTDEDDGKSFVIQPYIDYDVNDEITIGSTIVTDFLLYRGQLIWKDYITINQNSSGVDLNQCKGSLIDFLIGSSSSIEPGCLTEDLWDNPARDLDYPILKISVISQLIDDNSQNVPYLEYQLISSSNLAGLPTDTYQTITAEGVSGTFKQILEVKQPQVGGLPEYVIQQ